MKRIFFLIISVLVGIQVNAQDQDFKLTGKVVNRLKEPLEFANISLLTSENLTVQQTITDSLGIFIIKAQNGNYKLLIEEFGQILHSQNIEIKGDTELGEISVEESVMLEGVVIEGRKKLIERKVDRLVFNVENSVSASGGNALDALKSTPMVRIQNESVSIIGKGEVLVMIDDRLQRLSPDDLASLLKSIPSDNIKSIEVITTPPAKYEAEGNGGIINIKLKTASPNSWNTNLGSSYTQRTYASNSLRGLFNYNQNRLSLQASVNTENEKLFTTSENRYFYPDELWKQNVEDESKNKSLSLGFGIDYDLNDKWTTGLKYLGSFTDNSAQNNPFTVRTNRNTAMINSFISSEINENNNFDLNSFNWFNKFDLDSLGTNITTNFDYFSYKKNDFQFYQGNELDENREIIPSSYFSSTNTNINRIDNYSGKVDVEMPLKSASLAFGGKFSHTKTDNDLVVFDNETGTPILNINQSNVFSYVEKNEALYISLSKEFSEKWETKVGLRMEATQTKGHSENLDQTNKNDYLTLFPTAYLTYTPNDNHSFSLNYSRRIRRPSFDYLNPFMIRTSPFNFSVGNPFLKPSFIDNIEFSYINHEKWFSSIYYLKVSDFAQNLSILNVDTNVTKDTPLNYADTDLIGISSYYNFNKLSWWNSFTGFNLNYQNVKSKVDFINSIDGYNAYLYSNNDFTLNESKTTFFSVNYALQFPGRYQIFHISTLNILDVSMKFLFFDKDLSLTLTAEDLLNGQRALIEYRSNDIITNSKSYDDTRFFRISLSYKFGNNNLKSKERDFGNEEERNRAN